MVSESLCVGVPILRTWDDVCAFLFPTHLKLCFRWLRMRRVLGGPV